MSGAKAHDRYLYTYPEWQMRCVLTLDCGLFFVMWQWGPQTLSCAGWEEVRDRSLGYSIITKSDTQNENHWHVSVNITSGSFTLVHKHRIPRQSPLWRCLRGNAHESNAYNPASSASILWCTHLLYSQQLAASGLPTVSISWHLSFTTAQGLWLPGVPITIFLQNFLFTLWAPHPSRVSIG